MVSNNDAVFLGTWVQITNEKALLRSSWIKRKPVPWAWKHLEQEEEGSTQTLWAAVILYHLCWLAARCWVLPVNQLWGGGGKLWTWLHALQYHIPLKLFLTALLRTSLNTPKIRKWCYISIASVNKGYLKRAEKLGLKGPLALRKVVVSRDWIAR